MALSVLAEGRAAGVSLITLLSLHLKDQYQLHLGEFTGNAGDALDDAHVAGPGSPCADGVKFSTYDRPNCIDADVQCVRHSKSGWWFSR